MRGENQNHLMNALPPHGTSPRARGKHAWGLAKPRLRRNIPACAGKTFLASPGSRWGKEHPRVRGENIPRFQLRHRVKGTSPRARGKLVHGFRVVTNSRNIPACAGKTVCAAVIRSRIAEHPRVRGENVAEDQIEAVKGGTSPRARGKLIQLLKTIFSMGNIPACAGKTFCNPLWGAFRQGTSPRARGKPLLWCRRAKR